jgi:hypothetical protein
MSTVVQNVLFSNLFSPLKCSGFYKYDVRLTLNKTAYCPQSVVFHMIRRANRDYIFINPINRFVSIRQTWCVSYAVGTGLHIARYINSGYQCRAAADISKFILYGVFGSPDKTILKLVSHSFLTMTSVETCRICNESVVQSVHVSV